MMVIIGLNRPLASPMMLAQSDMTPFGQLINRRSDADEVPFTGGEQYDAESGLYSYKYRSYNPQLGRWMSPDPSDEEFARVSNPQSLNLYSYVINDPLKYVDDLGLAPPNSCSAPPNPVTNCPSSIWQKLNNAVLNVQGGLLLQTALAVSSKTGAVIGFGVDVSGGIGFLNALGYSADGSVEVVVDKYGNIGLAGSISTGIGVGTGIVAGAAITVSPYATSINSLSGPSIGYSVGGGDELGALVTLSNNAGATMGITVGLAAGGFGAATSIGPTKVIPLVCGQ